MDGQVRQRGVLRGLCTAVAALALVGVPAAVTVASGCGTKAASGGSGSPPPSLGSSTSPSPGDKAGGSGSGSEGGAGGAAAARAEIERRLALRRFTYVAETDFTPGGGAMTMAGALAVIDARTDELAWRPRMGTRLEAVAVSPDGRLVYVTDAERPFIHVVDAETRNEVRRVRLPGVEAFDRARFTPTGAMCYADMQSCSSAVACTPDGAAVLVLSKAGLQVIDTATFTVVRTLPELADGFDLALSFDGARAYVATLDYLGRADRTLYGWADLTVRGEGGGLALLDLTDWQVVRRVSCGLVGGMAVDPDDSRLFVSDHKLQSLRVVDPSSLRDLAVVDLKTGRADAFQPRGVGVLPDGSKVYVVCADTSPDAAAPGAGASPDEYFCAVLDAASREVIKRIPLDAY